MSAMQFQIDFTTKLPPAEQMRKEDGMARAEAHADREWTAAVKHAIWTTCRELPEFTADDVWERFERVNTHGADTHLKDAIGPLLKAVAAEGGMHATQAMRRSKRKGSHGNALVIWASLKYRGGCE